MYIELHAASAFSFLEAAALPERLIERAAELGYPALALLDRDGVYGAPRFHLAAKEAGIKALIGAELSVHVGGAQALTPWRLPVLVESQSGYRQLCRLLTRMKTSAPKGEAVLALEDLDGITGLVALAGRSVLRGHHFGVGGLLDRLIGLFGRKNVFVEVQRHFQRDVEADNEILQTLASAFHVPVLATNGVRFATPDERPLFDVLTCIRHKTSVSRAGRRLAVNAERYLKPPEDMAALFSDLPDAVAMTRELADRLSYTMADLGYRFPDYPVPEGETMISFLRKMTDVGARERYRPYHDAARAQVARELALIETLQLAGYFLIVWDIVNYCRRHGILVQGRGSAANSAVCYSLGITSVDPVKMELLFERFLSEERGEWPDIDLDLPSGDRREQVIQYVYERYGRLGAAMTANVITYRGRSAAREVGKALDIDAADIDQLAKVMNNFEWRDPNESLVRNLGDAGIDPAGPTIQHFASLWGRLQRLPRHLGQHSGGMVICQGRLDEVVPLENASMPGRVVLQWDKDDCADMGIVKVDLLGLGMMAVLQDALAMINTQMPGTPAPSEQTASGQTSNGQASSEQGAIARPTSVDEDPADIQPARLDLAHLPHDDPAVYRLLQTADTIGIFQVESRAQMATLPRLKPKEFYDIVVEVAIIRPGPIVGQMVHPYLSRRAGREKVEYPHPSLEPILKRTLGVPLFQEQLLRMAMVAAGFTGGEAEELRRALGFRRSEERMKKVETKLRAGMARQGIEPAVAEQILVSITSFALYGFPESHAASFALLVYASAYLKVHYPAVFYTALLNNQPMGFYHPATLVKDAQRRGVRFKSVDVQISQWECVVEVDGAIRLGLRFVQGIRADMGKRIAGIAAKVRMSSERERQGRGPHEVVDRAVRDARAAAAPARVRFASLDHFIETTGIRRDELARLAEIGALNAFGYDRRGALWQVERAVRPGGELFESTDRAAWDVFQPADDESSPLEPMTLVERVVADYEGTSLTIGPHPMSLKRADLAWRGVLRAIDLPVVRNGRRVRVAGSVITRQRPGTAKGFVFLTLEDETGIANIIVRPDLFDIYRVVIVKEPFLLIEGIVQQQDGVTSVRAEHVQSLVGDDASGAVIPSYDFH